MLGKYEVRDRTYAAISQRTLKATRVKIDKERSFSIGFREIMALPIP